MARNSNPVFQTLFPTGNQNVLPAGQPISALASGQIGVFDAETHLSIDGSTTVNRFYLFVGYDKDGDGQIDDIHKSAGDWIIPKSVHSYTRKDYQAGQNMEVEVDGIKGECNRIYALRVVLFNDEIYKRQGYNFFSRTYAVKHPCCDGCSDCTSGDCNEVVKQLLISINEDPNGLIEAYAVDPANNVIADIDAFIAANKAVNTDNDPNNDVCAKLRIRTKPIAGKDYCGIPFRYYHPLRTRMEVSLMDELECNGVVTVIQPLIYEEGAGYFVRKREFDAGGWNGRPGTYRLVNDYGPLGKDYDFHSDLNTNYNQVTIEYSNSYAVGWQDFDHNITTEIYIPTTDTATMNTLLAVLNNILTPFGFPSL